MIKRRILPVFLSLLVISLMIAGAQTVLAAEQRVFDDAKLLSTDEITQLNDKIATLTSELNQDFVVVTTNDAQGSTAQEYADNYYDEHGFGIGENKNGVLFLIDMDNREVYISTCGEMIDYLTDARIKILLNHAVAHLKKKEYYAAADDFLSKTQSYIISGVPNNQYRQDISDPDYPKGENDNTPTEGNDDASSTEETNPFAVVMISVIIALVVGAACCGIIAAKYNMSFSAYQYPFRQKSQVQLICVEDRFRNQTLTQHHIDPPDSGNSHSEGGGGLSSTHTSSSGTTHGGGGASF